MRCPKFLFGAVVVYLCALTTVRAADLKVIANPSVAATSVSAADLKGVFLATKTSLSDGSHVEPVVADGGPAHEAFIKEYLGKTDSGLQAYYRSLVFTGKGNMPKSCKTDQDVVNYVAKTKGAIGYVSGGFAAPGVKSLTVN